MVGGWEFRFGGAVTVFCELVFGGGLSLLSLFSFRPNSTWHLLEDGGGVVVDFESYPLAFRGDDFVIPEVEPLSFGEVEVFLFLVVLVERRDEVLTSEHKLVVNGVGLFFLREFEKEGANGREGASFVLFD